MIDARNLTKIFRVKIGGELGAADTFSYHVALGPILGVDVPTAAGPTTALPVHAGVRHRTRGGPTLAGFDVEKQPEKVRVNVGSLAASTALYGRLTAREMITYFGRLNGMTDVAIRTRIKQLADELDMHEFLDRRCEKFSTGM